MASASLVGDVHAGIVGSTGVASCGAAAGSGTGAATVAATVAGDGITGLPVYGVIGPAISELSTRVRSRRRFASARILSSMAAYGPMR